MNTETCFDLINYIKNAVVLAPAPREGLCMWGDFQKTISVKYKRWKLRYIPGISFIFNGKQRIQHEIIFPRDGNNIYGFFYRGNEYVTRKYFFKSPLEIAEVFKYVYWWDFSLMDNEENILKQKYCVFPQSEEEKKIEFISYVAKDLGESLEIETDEDIKKFKQTIDIISVRNL